MGCTLHGHTNVDTDVLPCVVGCLRGGFCSSALRAWIPSYPAPPLRKHQPGQESDGQTGSWCLDKAVQPRDARYQKKACPENLPIPHPNHNSRNRAVLVGLWGMGATLGAPKL